MNVNDEYELYQDVPMKQALAIHVKTSSLKIIFISNCPIKSGAHFNLHGCVIPNKLLAMNVLFLMPTLFSVVQSTKDKVTTARTGLPKF